MVWENGSCEIICVSVLFFFFAILLFRGEADGIKAEVLTFIRERERDLVRICFCLNFRVSFAVGS